MKHNRHRYNQQKNHPKKINTPVKKILGKEKIIIHALATDGKGIGKTADGTICFVKNLLPKEQAFVQMTEEKSSFKLGSVVPGSLENQSPLRITPKCVYVSANCGGCQIQHIAHSEQSQVKTQWLFETLKRIGKWHESYLKYIESQFSIVYLRDENYRRRICLHFDGKKLGFFAENSHTIIDINNCMIARTKLNQKISTIKKALLDLNTKFKDRFNHNFSCDIELTEGDDTKVVLHLAKIELNVQSQSQTQPPAQSHGQIVADLEKQISEILGIQSQQLIQLYHPDLGKFKVSKVNFVQPHFDCLVSYYSTIKKVLTTYLKQRKPQQLVAWDLYCGAGYFTGIPYFLATALNIPVECIGVEGMPTAIASFQHNYKGLPIQGKAQDVREFIDQHFQNNLTGNIDNTSTTNSNTNTDNPTKPNKFDIAILDPPRGGLGVLSTQKLIELSHEHSIILYLSCDAACFARDSSILLEGGFKPSHMTLFNAFPQTNHYEVFCSFQRHVSQY